MTIIIFQPLYDEKYNHECPTFYSLLSFIQYKFAFREIIVYENFLEMECFLIQSLHTMFYCQTDTDCREILSGILPIDCCVSVKTVFRLS